jgi:hypothetical protein
MATQIVWRGRDLIGDGLWLRLIGRILADLEFWQYCGHYDEAERRRWAERILDQTLAFLRVCADHPDAARFCPSPLIDIGWHAFILYTREYHEFCDNVAGHYIHHSPSDEEGVAYGTGGSAEAVAAMRARGIAVDEQLWGAAGSCNPPRPRS